MSFRVKWTYFFNEYIFGMKWTFLTFLLSAIGSIANFFKASYKKVLEPLPPQIFSGKRNSLFALSANN